MHTPYNRKISLIAHTQRENDDAVSLVNGEGWTLVKLPVNPGMVGWAGGAGGGPHFFIYMGAGPAEHWLHDHTVWGELADEASKDAVERILSLPSADNGGMTMLNTRAPFQVEPIK